MDKNGSSQQYQEKVSAALRDKSTLISLGIFVVFLIIAGILIFTNQRRLSVADIQNKEDITNAPSATPSAYIVKANDTLYGIAEAQYGTGDLWPEIARANNLDANGSVTEGQRLVIPRVSPTAGAVAPTGAPTAPASSPTAIPSAVPTAPAEAPAQQQGQVTGGSTSRTPKVKEYTVKAGDTLWDISQQVYGDPYAWSTVARANNLDNPDLIYPGQKFSMPQL
jgi:nucleoid-associated protein YgaU